MKVSLVIGPGHHDQHLIDTLIAAQTETLAVRSWPEFVVESWKDGSLKTIARHPAFGRLRWLLWALWRRIPHLRHWDTPRIGVFSLFDRLASAQIGPCDLFIGWSQVCMLSMERAKAQHAVTLLEHPMIHIDAWTTIVTQEYAAWATGATRRHSMTPRAVVRRMRREYQMADFISVPSSFAQQTFLAAGFPREKIVRMPLGIDTDTFHPGPRRSGRFRILFVGRLELCKGLQYLLQAFSRLKSSAVELWLVGPIMPEIKPLLDKTHDQRVRVLGPVAQAELPALYQSADVLVFPTVYDAFGLVILEAMACGIPVIATEHSAAPDIIDEGSDGFIIPIRDATAIEQRIRWIIDRRQETQLLREAARDKVVRDYSLEQYAERVVQIVTRITGGGDYRQRAACASMVADVAGGVHCRPNAVRA
jgi:glycosyltransferase involved in cell wall biosynthesis